MIDITKSGQKILIHDSNKKELVFDEFSKEIFLDGYDVNYPGEYEKSGILGEVKEYASALFFKFMIDSKRFVFLLGDSFELKEEILSFFGDVDVLFIPGTKDAVKVYESIEAKLVVPYGESKDLFLSTLGQHIEPVSSYKVKAEFALDATEFVNLQ